MTQPAHDTAPTQFAEAGSTRFAYRRFGTPQRTPAVLFQHFMGNNLHDHDPAISDGLATDREVILFNNTGVASTSGLVPETIEQMATDAARLIEALGLGPADLVGHSMGGLVAQQLAIQHPDPGRRLVLVGTGPRGGERIGELPPQSAALFGMTYPRQQDMWLAILFAPTTTSQKLGRDYPDRIAARKDRDQPFSEQSVLAQTTAIAAYGAAEDPAYRIIQSITAPVLVVNGTDNTIVATINSYILQQFLPNAQLLIYPDVGHGAHFQYPDLFLKHVRLFLDEQ